MVPISSWVVSTLHKSDPLNQNDAILGERGTEVITSLFILLWTHTRFALLDCSKPLQTIASKYYLATLINGVARYM